MATKLARNVVTYGCWRAVHEAVELASAAGIAPDTFLDVIEASDREGIALLGLQRLRMSGNALDYASRSVDIYQRNMNKDLEAAKMLAVEKGVTVPLVDVAIAQSPDTFAWLEERRRTP
jgi:3-hydroxyisobutyrate dehydrogenase-like beta-hydroxyacid dehydrogenase